MVRWFPIESNPDVMNEYIKALGVTKPSVEMVDVYGVTEEMLQMVPQPVYAVALVFPITHAVDDAIKAKAEAQADEVKMFCEAHKFFYTKQFVSNACGTIAILHMLVNNYSRLGVVEKGSVLEKLFEGGVGAPADAVGNEIAKSDALAGAHATAAEKGETENKDINANINLHFVTFVMIGDRCVELDGRQERPILHETCSDEKSFLYAAAAAIQERMSLVPDSLEFGITALVQKSD